MSKSNWPSAERLAQDIKDLLDGKPIDPTGKAIEKGHRLGIAVSIPSKWEEGEINALMETLSMSDDESEAFWERCVLERNFRRWILRLARSRDGVGVHRLMAEYTHKAS